MVSPRQGKGPLHKWNQAKRVHQVRGSHSSHHKGRRFLIMMIISKEYFVDLSPEEPRIPGEENPGCPWLPLVHVLALDKR